MKHIYASLLCAAALLLLAACPNSMLGLGDKIDIDPPSLGIGSYADGRAIVNGDYVRGVIELNGSSDDDIAVKKVLVSLDGGKHFAVGRLSQGGSHWSYTVNTADYEDGEKEIIIRVQDGASSPRESEKHLLLYFDNTPPTVVVKNPAGYRDSVYSDAELTIRGEASDPFRIRKVEGRLIGGNGELGRIEGTASWTCSFSSSGSGRYAFLFTAEDYAGNRSSWFYHYDDLLSAADGELVTVEELHRIENGASSSVIDREQLEDFRLEELPLEISMDQDIPQIAISNPDPQAQLFDNVMPGKVKFIGSVSDDDGIRRDSLAIRIDGGPWKQITKRSSGALHVNWEYPREFDSSGDHILQVRVEDIHGTEALSRSIPFRVNTDAALVQISRPALNAYCKSDVIEVSGTAEDPGGAVTDLELSVDGGTWKPVDQSGSLPSSRLDWSYTTSSLADGTHSIKLRASDDNGGSWTYSNLQFSTDTHHPTASLISPAQGAYCNGVLDIRGSAGDNLLLEWVEVKVGDNPDRPWKRFDGSDRYSWDFSIDTRAYENSRDGSETEPGSGVFRLPVYLRAGDAAGNILDSGRPLSSFYIDNELDRPVVDIAAPSNNASLGGSVRVSGTAVDDDGPVEGVYLYIDLNTPPGGEPNFADIIDLEPGQEIDFDGPGGEAPLSRIDESRPYRIQGTSPWSVELNRSGELYNCAADHRGDIHLRFFATDTSGGGDPIESREQRLHIHFDDTIPRIHSLQPENKSYQRERFIVTADVEDETRIKDLSISYDGGSSFHPIIRDGVKSPGSEYLGGFTEAKKRYSAKIALNSLAVPGIGELESDDLNLVLRVRDDTGYQSEERLQLYVDNLIPSAWMNQDCSDIFGAGAHASFTGYASDPGGVSGLRQISVYFEKDGQRLSPYPDSGESLIVIDNRQERLDGLDLDGDGIHESFRAGEPERWQFRLDSALLPDGKAQLHYRAVDLAGNSYEGQREIFIKNDKPQMAPMSVGYDMNGNGKVEGDEIFTDPGGFKAKGLLYIGFHVTDQGGIDRYEVYEGQEATGEAVLSGESGTLDISTLPDGERTYLCRVVDSDGIQAERLLHLEIDNSDEVAPSLSLMELDRDMVIDGNLEPAGESIIDGPDADLSGSALFHGSASDDQGIKRLYLSIDGQEKELAAWRDGKFVAIDKGFQIEHQSFLPRQGHSLRWTYQWNSASLPEVAKRNVEIRFYVEDFSDTGLSANDGYTLDILPYISRIETSLSSAFSDDFSRSALGRYPVWVNSESGEAERIILHGYNLDPSTGGVYLRGEDRELSLDWSAPGDDKQSIELSLASGGVPVTGSGELRVSSNGIDSANNRNDNSLHQIDAPRHQSLNDDCYLSVWDLVDLKASYPLAENAVYPAMSMKGDKPAFSYQNNSNGWGIAVHFDGEQEKKVYENWDLFTFSAIDHNGAGDHGLLYDINVVNGNFGDYKSGNYGGILASFFDDVPATSWDTWAYRFARGQLWLDNLVDQQQNTTAVLNRYQYPDLSLQGDSSESRVYYTVYDDLRKRILFRSFRVGRNNSIDNDGGGSFGSGLYTDLDQYDRDGNFPNYSTSDWRADKRFIKSSQAGRSPDGEKVVAQGSSGPYSAVAADSSGSTAFVAYYDGSGTGKVCLKWLNLDKSTADWESLPAGPVIDSGHGGEYIDMKLDGKDNIHIAYYDNNNGDLRYIYIPAAHWKGRSVQRLPSYLVDSYMDVGERLSLELDSEGKPLISYKGINRSAKLARLVAPEAGNGVESDRFNGTWEVMILPRTIQPSDSNRYCVGIDGKGLPIVGYTNGGIEYLRLLEELQ